MSGLFDDQVAGDDEAPTTTATATAKPTGPAITTVGLLERQLDRKIEETGATPLGALVWWAFEKVELSLDDMKKLVASVGLDPTIVPVPEARGALADAIDALKLKIKRDRHKLDDKRFAISLNVAEVREDGGATVNVRHHAEQVVEYNFDTKQLTFRNNYMEPEIREGFKKFLVTLQSGDLRTIVMRTLKASNSITVREKGGVYFVPRQALDTVAKLRALCGQIPGAVFNRLRIADEPEEREDMLKTAGAEIEAELADAEKEMQEINDKAKEGKIRGDTIDRRIKTFGEIKAKALAYKDLLNFKAEDVEERLNKLQNQAAVLLELA